MSESAADGKVPAREVSAAVSEWGWRLVPGALVTSVPVESLAAGADLAARLAAGVGHHRGQELRLDVRSDRLIIQLQSANRSALTAQEIELAHRISAFTSTLGLATAAGGGAGRGHPVQVLEVAIDAQDILAIRPFWKVILGYADEPGDDDPDGAIADPAGRGPTVWFQQMDAPRPQRNRLHFDISVPHDEAQPRIAAAIAAGGTLTYDAEAPAFWVLADPEGNEACILTWQGRDGS